MPSTEASLRRSSTIRQTSRVDSDDSSNAPYKCISLRIATQDDKKSNASQDQLFSIFTSLVAEVHLSVNTVADGFLDGIINRDIAIADFGTQFIGRGRSFSVRLLKLDPPNRSLAVKSVLPFGDFTSREEKERLADVILELRALSHRSLRGHPNITELLGLCWETDSIDLARKWPVLILEYADGGTLEDFLQRYPDITFQERLELCLGVSNGLDALHSCAIVHGDLKPGNVLICAELNSGKQRKWTAKLADFGGSVLDVGENELGRLSMGSFPWQAPEWEDWLSRKNLLATDIYSLGLLIWSVMARGLEPAREDLEFLDLEHYSADGKTLQNKVSMLKREKPLQFLEYLKRSAQRRFALDVDHGLIGKALSVAVAKNPDSRNVSELNRLLQNTHMAMQGSSASDQKSQLPLTSGDTHPNFRPITTISNIENILMAPDMLDTLSPTIRKYVRERLELTYQQSKQNEQKAASAFSLAVEALRKSHEPQSESDCLMWLVRSARAGSQSAQSLVVRFHRTFNRDAPLDVQKDLKVWTISAAERNFPAAQEDLDLLCTQEERSSVWRRIRSGYTNTGWNRFGALYHDTTTTLEELGQGLRDRVIRQMQSPAFDPKDFDLNKDGDNLLHLAAFAGLGSMISLWKTSTPIDINGLGSWDESALLHACRSGHFEEAMMLLDLGADPKLASVTGDTPLHWLVNFEGQAAEKLGKRLSEAGADVNAAAKDLIYPWSPLCNYEHGTPLHRAVGRGKVDAVKALLRINAEANHAGARSDKKCPIYLAAQFYYPEILDLLLRSLGTEAPAARPYRGRLSLLIGAIHGNDLYGLKFSMVARHGEHWLPNLHKTVEVLLENGAAEHLHGFPDGLDCARTTPLQVATGMGCPEVVEYLLQKGCTADVNKTTFLWTDGADSRPLVKSIYSARKHVFDILLANGADPSQPHFDQDGKELSYLWQCAFAGHEDASFAQELLARGVPVDGTVQGFETPFATAVRNRCFELAKHLLEHGADPHVEYSEGLYLESSETSTVLGFLIREQTRSALAAVNWLLREVPEMSFVVSSTKKNSVLHICAVAKTWARNEADDGACKLLADGLIAHYKPTKSELDQQDADGQTALYCATLMNNFLMVKILVDAGADARIRNKENVSAVDANAMLLQILKDDPMKLVDETDPRPFAKQIDRRMKNQNIIRQHFARFEDAE